MRVLPIVGLTVLLASGCATLRAKSEICGGDVVFLENREFKVNSNADKLICGDENLNAWREIPPNQQQLMITGLLKKEGFHRPTYKLENGKLLVTPGAVSRIHRVEFINPPSEFFDYKPPQFEGRIITTETLDALEKWSLERLHDSGYPCATVETLASVEDESVLIKLKPGTKRTFPTVVKFGEGDLPQAVESRYRAFYPGEVYQASLLKLSAQRMEIDGVATRSVYAEKCEDKPGPETPVEIPIEHRVTLGPSRLIQLGVGFSTEEYLLARGSWKNTRVGERASLLSATLNASFIAQSLDLVGNYYVSDESPRFYLAPKVTLEHRDERTRPTEYDLISVPLMAGWSKEFRKGVFRGELGPNFFYENQIRGPNPGPRRLLLGDTSWSYRSHNYEIRMQRPSEGFEGTLDTSSILRSLDAGALAHRVTARGIYLWNIGPYEPARWVLGVRGKIQSLLRDRSNSNLRNIPTEFFTWLGGQDDLRGFGRRELPLNNGDTGEVGARFITAGNADVSAAVSSAYLGTELRLPQYFGEGLDPLVFLDTGLLGYGTLFQYTSQLYYSPGIGARYQSPIGAVRATVARGFIPGADAEEATHEHMQFYISLGREF